MTKILDKQKETTTWLIIPDNITSIFYQPILLFCFLIWGKPNGPFLQAFMATILPICKVQCLQLVDNCVLKISRGFCMWLVHWFFNNTMTAEVGIPWDEIVVCGELLKTEENLVVACLEAPLQNLLGCTEEEHDEYHQCKQYPNQTSNHVPCECKWSMLLILLIWGGMRWHVWFRHCATSQKVSVSIPDGVIGIFHWPNPSSHTVALGSTHPLPPGDNPIAVNNNNNNNNNNNKSFINTRFYQDCFLSDPLPIIVPLDAIWLQLLTAS